MIGKGGQVVLFPDYVGYLVSVFLLLKRDLLNVAVVFTQDPFDSCRIVTRKDANLEGRAGLVIL